MNRNEGISRSSGLSLAPNVSRADAESQIASRLEAGFSLLEAPIDTEDQLETQRSKYVEWDEHNVTMLLKLFVSPRISQSYEYPHRPARIIRVDETLADEVHYHRGHVKVKIARLKSIAEQLSLDDEPSGSVAPEMGIPGLYKEHWHGFDIVAGQRQDGTRITCRCEVIREGKRVFTFDGQTSLPEIVETAALKPEPREASPPEMALAWVHGIIDLRTFEPGDSIKRSLYEPRESAIRSRELEGIILQVFYTIQRELPRTYVKELVDVNGLCMELGISENAYLATVDYLIGKRWLRRFVDRLDNYSQLYITPEGIDEYHGRLPVGPVVEELVAETREFVDGKLELLCPQAARKLNETYKDLIEGSTELKSSQVAYACRLILQDFTDAICDPGFLGETIDVPEKDKTKDKLRAALQARRPKVPDTERELLEALAGYIDDYFNKLNKYIQKQVHPGRQAQVETESAKRCLIYTYLLIADALSLLS